MPAVMEARSVIGMRGACRALDLAPASVYRDLKPSVAPPRPRPASHRALTPIERFSILDTLDSPEFLDRSPHAAFYTLLDRGEYIASPRTFYRVLHEACQIKERRAVARHPHHAAPRLLANGPNQIWSWDITRLRAISETFFLYVILDIFSRFIVGWTIASAENARIATRLIEETFLKWNIEPGSLIIHSDRGAPMTARSTKDLLDRLGAAPSFSRPRVSNDNPFSEALFKTTKYAPDYPHRFGGLDDARTQIRRIFSWYNHEHHHSSLAFLTPTQIHFDAARPTLDRRANTLLAAFQRNPERFARGLPTPRRPQPVVWINPPILASSDSLSNSNHRVSHSC